MVGISERYRVVIPCGIVQEIWQEILMVCPPYEKNISAVIINFRFEVSRLDCVQGGQ
jgi:hypothetical protein